MVVQPRDLAQDLGVAEIFVSFLLLHAHGLNVNPNGISKRHFQADRRLVGLLLAVCLLP